ETHARAAPGILSLSLVRGIENDLARHAPDRQVADDAEDRSVIEGRTFDTSTAEGDDGELLDVEEVGRAQMCVALVGASVDARCVQLHLDCGTLRARLVDGHGPPYVGDATLHGCDL